MYHGLLRGKKSPQKRSIFFWITRIPPKVRTSPANLCLLHCRRWFFVWCGWRKRGRAAVSEYLGPWFGCESRAHTRLLTALWNRGYVARGGAIKLAHAPLCSSHSGRADTNVQSWKSQRGFVYRMYASTTSFLRWAGCLTAEGDSRDVSGISGWLGTGSHYWWQRDTCQCVRISRMFHQRSTVLEKLYQWYAARVRCIVNVCPYLFFHLILPVAGYLHFKKYTHLQCNWLANSVIYKLIKTVYLWFVYIYICIRNEYRVSWVSTQDEESF